MGGGDLSFARCNNIYIYIHTHTHTHTKKKKEAYSVIDIIVGNGDGDLSSIPLDYVVYISNNTNIIEKIINWTLLLPAMGKIVLQTGFFSHGTATGLREEKV